MRTDLEIGAVDGRQLFSLHGGLILGDQVIDGGIVVEFGRIADIRRGAAVADMPAPVTTAAYVSPGFVDLQVNGGYGIDVGIDAEALRQLACALPRTGVTAFLPTLISSPHALYEPFMETVRAARADPGARILGAHLEGPYLSSRRPGAHRVELIESAQLALLESLFEYESLRLVTLAPEPPGALEKIRALTERGITVSLGHTDATFDQMVSGFDAGATMVTHLYNAMAPFGHRAPGPVAAALLDSRVTVSVIADGIHVHPEAVQLAIRVKTHNGVVLVTDMMAAAGMGPGTHELGGQQVFSDGERASLPDGTLAGSVATLDSCLRNVVTWTPLSLAESVQMITVNPYRALGQSGGTISIGAQADLLLLDPALEVQATIIGGALAYQRLQSSP